MTWLDVQRLPCPYPVFQSLFIWSTLTAHCYTTSFSCHVESYCITTTEHDTKLPIIILKMWHQIRKGKNHRKCGVFFFQLVKMSVVWFWRSHAHTSTVHLTATFGNCRRTGAMPIVKASNEEAGKV